MCMRVRVAGISSRVRESRVRESRYMPGVMAAPNAQQHNVQQQHNQHARTLNAHRDNLLERSLGRHRDILQSERDTLGGRRQADKGQRGERTKRDFPFGANRRTQVSAHSFAAKPCRPARALDCVLHFVCCP